MKGSESYAELKNIFKPGKEIGLSEYSNANFFSNDTIYASGFPYPYRTGKITVSSIPDPRDPSGTAFREYHLWNDGYGQEDYRLAATSFVRKYWTKAGSEEHEDELPAVLDSEVYADYSGRLIPRAVGYASQVLSYFFRGKLELSLAESRLSVDPIRQGFDGITLLARNITGNGGKTENGKLTFAGRYKMPDETSYRYVSKDICTGCSVPDETSEEFEADLTGSPIPMNASEISFYLVYRGTLGTEDDAVAVGFIGDCLRTGIEISLPGTGAYGVISDPDSLNNPSAQGFDTVKVCVKNVSAEGEDMSGGKLTAVVKYRLSQGNPFQTAPSGTSDEFYYVTGETGDDFEVPRDSPATFGFSLNRPVPLWATDVYIYLIYRGKLGTEADGVAAGFKDISEPTPLWLFNATDRICLFGEIYDSGSDEARNVLDAPENGGNGNGKADDGRGIDSFDISNLVCSFSPAGTPPLTVAPGKDIRPSALLTDYEFVFNYSYKGPWGSFVFRKETKRYGIKNQYEASSLNVTVPPVRRVSYFSKFRGVTVYSGSTIIYFITPYPEEPPCAFPDAYDY